MSTPVLKKVFGNNLRRLRLADGMSQEAFAERLGMTQQKYQRWESGAFLPRADAIVDLANQLGITPNELLLPEAAARFPSKIDPEDLLTLSEFAKERGLASGTLVSAAVKIYADVLRKKKSIPPASVVSSYGSQILAGLVESLESVARAGETQTNLPADEKQPRKAADVQDSSEPQQSKHD